MRHVSRTKAVRILGASFVVFALVASLHISDTQSHNSVEVGFSALSPSGMAGGQIIPASCDSGWNHPEIVVGSACTSVANTCGNTAGGLNACGDCVPPANPAGYGTACTMANSCGQTNTGTKLCDLTCSVVAPPEANCTKPDLTAGNISPTNAVAGSAVSFSAVISNAGNANAPTSQTLFQRALDASGTGFSNLGTASANPIVSNGSVTSSYSYTFPAGDAGTTKYIRACADTGAAVTESNEGNNCGAWTAIAVTVGPQPDLTAGAVSPTSATAGTAVSFSALVSNIGTASAGGSQTLFQRADDANGTGYINLGSSAAASIALNAPPVSSSFTYTFPSSDAGTTRFVRVCADTGTTVTESNEGNNCGAWTAVVVNAIPTPSVSFNVSPLGITSGQSSSITWSSTNVTSCTGTNFSTSGATNNSTGVTVSPTITTTYSISCTGSYGTATSSKTVTVTPVTSADLTAGNVSPITAVAGSVVSLSAVVTNVGTASAGVSETLFQKATSAGGAGATPLGNGTAATIVASGSVTSSYSYTFPAGDGGTTKYIRACADTGGAVTESNEGNNCGAWTAVTVTAVGADPVPSVTLSVSPASIISGNSSTIVWSSANVTSCTGTNFSTSGATNNSTGVTVSPTVTTTYSISCTGSYGTVTGSKTITVGAAPKADLTAGDIDPTSAVAGTARNFSSIISNVGVANAGATLTRFERADTSGGAGATTLGSASAASIISNSAAPSTYSYAFPSGDAGTTKYLRACADTGGAITESDETNNCGDWTAINVTAAPQPDLTAGDVSPISAVAGSAVNFSALVSNIGTASAGASQTKFQKANSVSGAGAQDLGNGSATSIAANNSVTSTYGYVFQSSDIGTKYIRACADTGTVVTESNEGNNCGDWTAVTVTAVAQADLTAGDINPTSAVAGAATTFTIPIFNTGTATAGSTQTLIQAATDANGTGATTIGTAPASSISAKGDTDSTFTYTFPLSDAGTTRFVRACADNGHVVTESNENNNCGDWTAVAVVDSCVPNIGAACASTPNSCGQTGVGTVQCNGTCSGTTPSNLSCPRDIDPVIDFIVPPHEHHSDDPEVTPEGPSSSDITVLAGSVVTIQWSCPSATNSSSSNNFNTNNSVSGSASVTVTQTTTYTVQCDQTGGQTSLKAVVVGPAFSLIATPSRVHSGDTTVLNWYATNVQSCTLTGPNVSVPATATGGAIGSSGSPRQTTTGAISGQSTYMLTCQTRVGQISTSVTVSLIPVPIEI